MSKAYERLCAFVRAVTPAMTTQWEEPFRGEPSVFVCNHAGAFGGQGVLHLTDRIDAAHA